MPSSTLKNFFYDRICDDLRQNRRKSKTNIIKLYDQSFPAQNGVNYDRF